MSEQAIFTTKEVARRFGVSARTVASWISSGRIEHLKIGKTVRFTEQQIAKFENQSTVKAVA